MGTAELGGRILSWAAVVCDDCRAGQCKFSGSEIGKAMDCALLVSSLEQV